jgi:hypothetical protein
MSIDSAARQKKPAPTTTTLEPLLTRSELAQRWHVTAQHITRNYKKMGLRPIAVGKRRLFPESQVLEAERRATGA